VRQAELVAQHQPNRLPALAVSFSLSLKDIRSIPEREIPDDCPDTLLRAYPLGNSPTGEVPGFDSGTRIIHHYNLESEKASPAREAFRTRTNSLGLLAGIGDTNSRTMSPDSSSVNSNPFFHEGLLMTRRIECITKLPTHQDRHRRIQAVGGPGWKDSEETAIANVKRDPSAYEVTEQGKTVKVKVQTHDGREYLKTENDRFLPDNLLNLKEC